MAPDCTVDGGSGTKVIEIVKKDINLHKVCEIWEKLRTNRQKMIVNYVLTELLQVLGLFPLLVSPGDVVRHREICLLMKVFPWRL